MLVKLKDVQVYTDDANRRSDTEKDMVAVGYGNVFQLGDVVTVENAITGEQVYMKEHIFPNVKLFEDDVVYAKKRLKTRSPFLNKYFDFTSSSLKLPDKGRSRWVRHFFEIPKAYLTPIVESGDPVVRSNVFLTQLMYQMIEAGAALQEIDVSHGNINPDYISFKEPTSFRLVDNFRGLGKLDPVANDIQARRFVYCSPEVYQKVMTGESLERVNVMKHDVFCIGMMLLQMGTGCKGQMLYNPDGTINQPNFIAICNQFVRSFEQQDNRLLAYTVVENMLAFDPNVRLDFRSLKKKLPRLQDIDRYFEEEFKINQDMSCHDCRLRITQFLRQSSSTR